MRTPLYRRWPFWLAWFSLFSTVLAALALIAFAQPINDDFTRAIAPRSAWFAYIFHYLYFNWSGRWAGVGFSAFILPRVDPVRHYVLLLGILHGAQFGSLAVFWRLLLGPRAGWRRVALLTLGLYAVLWSASPAPGETYYWFSGGVEYSLSISLAILMLGALVCACGGTGRGRLGWTALAGAMALIVTGMHEVTGMCLCLILFTALAVALRRREGVGPVVFVTALAVAGTLIVTLAPGNAVRAATVEYHGSLSQTIRATLSLVVQYVIPWSRKPVLLAATAALLLTPLGGGRPDWARRPAVPWHWIFPAVTLGALAICLAAPCWAMGSINGRCLNAAQQFYLLGWFATTVAWSRRLGWLRPRLGPRTQRRLRFAALIVLAVSLWVTGNTRRSMIQLATTVPAWSRALTAQQTEARQAKAAGKLDAIVPAVSVERPSLFFEDGIGTDPNDWRNQHYAAHFGLRTIRTTAQTLRP